MNTVSDVEVQQKEQVTLRRRHWFVSAGLVILVLVTIIVLWEGLALDQSKVPSALLGKPAQPFSVQWIQGQDFHPEAAKNPNVALQDFSGKVLVLNFWASWCESCRTEARDLEAIWKKYRDRGVYVLGVAIQDTTEAAKQFAGYYGKTYLLGLDVDGRAAIDYGVSGVPETFLINGQGTIVYKETGPVDPAKLASEIDKLL